MTDTCTTRAIRCFSGHAVRRCLERGITALHVEQALEQGVLVITGGPGTGKTRAPGPGAACGWW